MFLGLRSIRIDEGVLLANVLEITVRKVLVALHPSINHDALKSRVLLFVALAAV